MNTTLNAGTRIFNRGDVANIEHFGTIVEVRKDRWGTHYRINIDEKDRTTERTEYEVPSIMVHEKDEGHGGTRIVTEQAYEEHRAEKIREFTETANRMKRNADEARKEIESAVMQAINTSEAARRIFFKDTKDEKKKAVWMKAEETVKEMMNVFGEEYFPGTYNE